MRKVARRDKGFDAAPMAATRASGYSGREWNLQRTDRT
jgi:hypothetical protein